MLYQNLTQKQQLKIHPQHLQMLQLLHLNTIQLEQRILNELEENPLIEEKADEDAGFETSSQDAQDYKDYDEYCYDDIPDYRLENAQHFQTQAPIEKPIVQQEDFRTELKNQLALQQLSIQETDVGNFIIDSLTDEGFLEFSHENLADDFSMKFSQWVEPELIQKIVAVIQRLDPVGVATCNIKDCLTMQLRKMDPGPDVKLAMQVLDNHYYELMHRNFEKIINDLKIEEDDLKEIFHLLGTLKLKPVAASSNTSTQTETILPDFILSQDEEGTHVSLARERSSKLCISSSWKKMVYDTEKSHTDNRSKQYLKSKLNAAEWFVNAIRQRETTMLKVMEAIVRLQHEFFVEGDITRLKPMILKNVADMVGVDISTVSRITCNKYIQTHFGNVLLKSLFTEGIANHKGEVVSNKVIQKTIEEVISTEDKKCPYSDQQLVKVLAKRGYEIARRTVTKYREQLRIPAAQMRAFLA